MPGVKASSRSGRSLSPRGTFFLCLLSGLLLSLCFPPLGLWPLAWVALIPWIIALRTGRGLPAFLGSWLGGVAFFGVLLYWLGLFGISVWLIVAVFLGAMLAGWGLFVRWIGSVPPALRVLGTAVLWCGVEWARGLGPWGFTWGWLGNSQSPCLPLLAFAHYGGTLGLSFLIVLTNASLAEIPIALLRRSGMTAAIARALLGCVVVAGLLGGAALKTRTRPKVQGTPVKVAVLQGNEHGPLSVSQVNEALSTAEREHTLAVYQDMTRQAAREGAGLVIWPESVLPTDPEDDPQLAARVSGIVRESNVWVLAGGPATDDRGRPWNSAFVYAPTGNIVSRYDKVQLVPFGEYVPFRDRLPFIKRYNVRQQDFIAGSVHKVLQAGTITVGPTICFESTFPSITWELVGKGAQVLVVMTNDSWFGRTSAAAQHQQMAVLRAVETGRWVLRAASTGLSAIISPEGQVVKQAGLYQPAVLTAEISVLSNRPRGPQVGPLVAWALLGLSFVYLLAPFALRTRRRGNSARALRTPPPRVRKR